MGTKELRFVRGAGLVIAVAGAVLAATLSSSAGALVIGGSGSTTTTTIFDDGGPLQPVLAPLDPTVDEFFSTYPGKPAPVVVTMKVTWSPGPLTPAAETAQKARVAQGQQQLAAAVNAVNSANPSATQSIVAATQAPISRVFFAALSSAAVAALRSNPLVISIAYDRLIGGVPNAEAAPTASPTARQNVVAQTPSQEITGATNLHNADITGSGTVVAVIDTGINTAASLGGRQLLANKIVAGKCFSNSYGLDDPPLCKTGSIRTSESEGVSAGAECDTSNLPGDGPVNTQGWCAHGTGVAASIAAGASLAGDEVAWAGLAPEAKLISVSAYHYSKECVNGELRFILGIPIAIGSTVGAWCGGVRRSDLHRSLDWIYGQRQLFNIAAINMSMGWFNAAATDAPCGEVTINQTNPSPDTTTIQAISDQFQLLRNAGVAPVAAAGNWNQAYAPTNDGGFARARPRIFPSCISSAVSAGGVTTSGGSAFVPEGTLASDSWARDTAWYASQGSTGIDLLAPGPATSLATANISASFALARQVAPWASVDTVEAVLKSTGVSKFMKWASPQTTKPRIQVDAAVNDLRQGLGLVPLTQQRIADSRIGQGQTCGALPTDPLGTFGRLGPLSTRRLKVTGTGGVPAGAKGVVLNATATETSTTSFATIWGVSPTSSGPTGRPSSSTLNWTAGETVANSVTVVPDSQGCISVFNERGTAQLVVEVEAYLSDDGTTKGMTTMTTPVRVFDSGTNRSGRFEVAIAGVNGVPADATSAWVSVSVNQASGGSAVALGAAPMTSAWPNALASSNLNVWSGRSFTNLALVKIGTGGKIAFHHSNGSARFVVDVLGYQSPTSTNRVQMRQLQRVLDTRLPAGTTGSGPKVSTSGTTVTLPPTVAIPAGATGVVVNLTTTLASGSTYVTSWSGIGAKPLVSQNQAVASRDVPATAIVPLNGSSFKVAVGAGQTDLVVDLVGFVK